MFVDGSSKAGDKNRVFCCRLSQEYKMAVVCNRSGIDAGEIDYSLPIEKFHAMGIGQLEDCLKTLQVLSAKCSDRIDQIRGGE